MAIPHNKKRVMLTLTDEEHKALRMAGAVHGKGTSQAVVALLIASGFLVKGKAKQGTEVNHD